MSEPTFYSTRIEDGIIYLSREESLHAIKSLRCKKGSSVRVTDGRGNSYLSDIVDDNPQECILTITGIEEPRLPGKQIHLAISPTKNHDRMEWLVEKCVELGVGRISFVIAARSERKSIRQNRLRQISISALKQSGNVWLPEIANPVTYGEFVRSIDTGTAFICHCQPGKKSLLGEVRFPLKSTVMVGPEGDFSLEEINQARSLGFSELAIGIARLRTETAGIAVCLASYFQNDH
jgi:16S rRNA (uracil1498-N3)-methyltransferase